LTLKRYQQHQTHGAATVAIEQDGGDVFAAARAKLQIQAKSSDPIEKAAAKKLLKQLEGPQQQYSNPEAPYTPSRWAHVSLEALFADHGNSIQQHGSTVRTGHQPVHGSSDENCVILYPDTGTYHCFHDGCPANHGDAATYLLSIAPEKGRSTIELELRAEYGMSNVTSIVTYRAQRAYQNPTIPLKPQGFIDITAEDLEDLVPQVNSALVTWNLQEYGIPHLFVHGSHMVRVERHENEPMITDLSAAKLAFEIGQATELIKTTTKQNEPVRAVKAPPIWLTSAVMAQPSFDWLPRLRQLVRRPFLTESGEMVTTPGYNAESGLYYVPRRGSSLAPITGSADDVATALAFLDEALCDFSFTEPADKTNALGLFLLPYVRNLVDGATPLHAIEASQPRTGKGKLLRALLQASMGGSISTTSQKRDDDEWRKDLTTIFRRGDECIVIDNVAHMLHSGIVASALTEPMWRDRILGGNETFRVPITQIWALTGNNPSYSDEIYRRRVPIRIEADGPHPEERTDFRHHPYDPWLKEQADTFVWAGCTLALAWNNAGRPRDTRVALGGYEDWAQIIGGMLHFFGIEGFLGNYLKDEETTNSELAAWVQFVATWFEEKGIGAVTVGELLPIALSVDGFFLGKTDSEKAMQTKLGSMLVKHRGAHISDWRLFGEMDKRAKRMVWRLQSGKKAAKNAVSEQSVQGVTEKIGKPIFSDQGCGTLRDLAGPFEQASRAPARVGARTIGMGIPEAKTDIIELRQHQSNSTFYGPAEKVPQGPARSRKPADNVPEWVPLPADPQQLATVLANIAGAPCVGFDIETTGLNPIEDKVRLIQIATAENVYILDCFDADPHILAPLFAADGPCFIGHNIEFDLAFMASLGLELQGTGRVFDTMLASQLLHAGIPAPKGTHTLKVVAERYLGVVLDKELQASDWSMLELTDEQLAYAARDAQILIPLKEALEDELAIAGLDRVATVEMAIVPQMARIHITGVGFNSTSWVDLANAAEQRRDAAERILNDAVAPQKINWSSPTQVLRYFNDKGHGLADTREGTLREIAPYDAAAEALLDYREAEKAASTYGAEFVKKWLSRTTSRIHARYMQLGAEATGRMSCGDPNMQNIPRQTQYRACFIPKPGHVFVKADYSQIELRIAAHLSQDKAMMEVYRQGKDIHKQTAGSIYDLSPEETEALEDKDDRRQVAKSANFSLVYGAGASTFQAYCARNKIAMSLEQAIVTRAKFLDTYPQLRDWQHKQGNASDPREVASTAQLFSGTRRSDRFTTRTLLGRRRLNVYSYTEKLNTPDQGTGADILKLALQRLWEDRAAQPDARVVIVVHDEIVLEVPEDAAPAAATWLRDHMEAAGTTLINDVPIIADAHIIQHWGQKE
jgi:DNA polymerase-1